MSVTECFIAAIASREYYPRRTSGGLAHLIEHAVIWSTVSRLVGHYLPQVGFGMAAFVVAALWAVSRLRSRRSGTP